MPRRLLRLELQGYKTFAARTEFEFGNIKCIIGPNGSGKSNIADSLRWVLGEQSFSLLRGRKTEDMIFSGSALRPRSSMASANVTLTTLTSGCQLNLAKSRCSAVLTATGRMSTSSTARRHACATSPNCLEKWALRSAPTPWLARGW
ncbi:chromosome partition protein Smc [Anaerolineaceae bacterium]|nr:chromosome partition protein Smc [Anaerolineaceae bacterium]